MSSNRFTARWPSCPTLARAFHGGPPTTPGAAAKGTHAALRRLSDEQVRRKAVPSSTPRWAHCHVRHLQQLQPVTQRQQVWRRRAERANSSPPAHHLPVVGRQVAALDCQATVRKLWALVQKAGGKGGLVCFHSVGCPTRFGTQPTRPRCMTSMVTACSVIS
jgi:hypothetical protein